MDSKKIIESETKELLNKLSIEGTITVEEEGEVINVLINTQEQGLLIGHHGNTLNSFQHILQTIIYKATQKKHTIVVNVGNYREKREETLRSLANQYAEQAKQSGETVTLPYLTPFERRIIHLELQDNPDVVSVSEGEGKDRRITIRLKNK